MKKALVMIIAATLTLGLASPASAAIKITKIYFDSPGADTGTNKSLNAEYVQIKNTGRVRVALSGWTLRDSDKHVYRFPTFRLGPGKVREDPHGQGRERRRQPLLAFQLLHLEQRWRYGHLEAEDRHDSVEVFLHGSRLVQGLLRGRTHGEEQRPRAEDRRCSGSCDPG
jgi:hypothetical protein